MRATRLNPSHLAAARSLLMQDVESNLFLLGLLGAHGLRRQHNETWLCVGEGSDMRALVYAGPVEGLDVEFGLVVPYGEPDACAVLGRELGRAGGAQIAIGPRDACDALWEGLAGPAPRIRYDQRLYVCDVPPVGPVLEVRQAAVYEVDVLAEMAGRMLLEDLGEDPRQRDAWRHHQQVRSRVLVRGTYVAEVAGRLAFKLDIGTLCPHGAQVGGTWTEPQWRGQGVATRAMRAVVLRLLERAPRVTLHVNEANLAAVRCYEAAGFRRAAPFRLVSR